MTFWNNATATVWQTLWNTHGSPTLRIYEKVTSWTMSAGVAYNPLHDYPEDGSGNPSDQNYASQDYVDSGYVPVDNSNNIMVDLVGVTERPIITVVLPYSSAIDTAIDDCWGIEVPAGSGNLYQKRNRSYLPPHNNSPSTIRLELAERSA